MQKQNVAQALVVTTHNGVFFGYGQPTTEPTIRIERARMCVFWSAATKSVLGLAAQGPDKDCKISPAVPAINLRDITAVMECSDEAAAAWEAQPWNSR